MLFTTLPEYKSLTYTPEQLGYTRKYKGRYIDYKGNPFLIVDANQYNVWIKHDILNSGCKIRLTYAELKKYVFIT